MRYKGVLIVGLLGFTLLFQNCSGFETTSSSSSSVSGVFALLDGSSEAMDPEFKIQTINDYFLVDQPMVFYPNPEKFPRYEDAAYAVEFSYNFTFDGDGECSFFNQKSGRIRHEIVCSGEGLLRLFQSAQVPLGALEVHLLEIRVVKGEGTQVALNASLEIPDWDTLPPTEESPVVAPEQPVTPPAQPPVAQSGAQLYLTNCASCHYPLSTSEKAGRNFSQIKNAIMNNSQMRNIAGLRALSDPQIQAIADALVR